MLRACGVEGEYRGDGEHITNGGCRQASARPRVSIHQYPPRLRSGARHVSRSRSGEAGSATAASPRLTRFLTPQGSEQIIYLLDQVREQTKAAVEGVWEDARKCGALHSDEMGWREDGQNRYIWSFSIRKRCAMSIKA